MKGTFQKRIERVGVLSKFAVGLVYLQKVKKASPARLGEYTRRKFTEMGPTFIKIGQFISTRSDIFGSDFVNEVKGLQDKIEPFYIPIENLNVSKYVTFDTKPIATASIGQVYKGYTQMGDEVAIKIKRPGIDEDINIDFDAFIFVLNILKVVTSKREAIELDIIINEYYRLLLEEIDFEKEKNNMIRFKKIFQNKKFVKVPKVYSEYSDNNVIVMEYVPALRIDDTLRMNENGLSTKKISAKLIELFLDQILIHGIVHIDPHPGNVGITPNGKIVFYDYGMIQKVGIDFKKDLRRILMAVYDRNIEYLCRVLIDSEIILIERDNIPYLKNFVLVFIGYIENLDINTFKEKYIDKIDQTELPFKISSKFLLILRGISILEGVCKNLDPDFNYRPIIETYLDDGNMVDISYIERKAIIDIDNMRAIPDKVKQNEINIEMIEKNIQQMRSGTTSYPSRLALLMMFVCCMDVIENIYVKIGVFAMTFFFLYK